MTNEFSLATDMVAFSNAKGGMIIIGANDDGTVSGLAREDLGRLSNLVSNAASQQVRPPINPITENLATDDGLVIVVYVVEGISKPYMDKNGAVWVKNGADKRRATAREEIQRMYQSAALIHGDGIPSGIAVADINDVLFGEFYEQLFGESVSEQDMPIAQILSNLNLAKDGRLYL